ncbi:hypothetical protein AYO40_01555 [Planctomycetaceae bacterium SCGC AG-212-D15]|nr:hypothetical protein AYO40_01555 [Planctomycetaceae bacterium SCGC AG-212-D15]
MFEAFFREKLGPLALRLALGSACVYHGFLKIMAHGGAYWTSGMPTSLQMALAWGEFVAGIAILLGFYCRYSAATVLAVTLGALAWWHGWGMFHLPLRTLEPTLMTLLIGLSLLFQGAGDLSLDARGGKGGSGASRAPQQRRAA